MPLTRRFLVSLCLALFSCSLTPTQIPTQIPTPGQAQDSYDTDYVLMIDTSISMNKPLTDPTLSKVKTAVREMVANDWLPRSLKQATPSRLYFYPFDSEVGQRREYDLTPKGAKDFNEYVEGLKARGWNTAIVSTLEHVLEDVPKHAFEDGRTVRRCYILISDGEETVLPEESVNQDTLYKLARKWDLRLEVTKFIDSCFIFRLGESTSPIFSK